MERAPADGVSLADRGRCALNRIGRKPRRHRVRLFVPPGHFYSPVVGSAAASRDRSRGSWRPVLRALPASTCAARSRMHPLFGPTHLAAHARTLRPFPRVRRPRTDTTIRAPPSAYGGRYAIVLTGDDPALPAHAASSRSARAGRRPARWTRSPRRAADGAHPSSSPIPLILGRRCFREGDRERVEIRAGAGGRRSAVPVSRPWKQHGHPVHRLGPHVGPRRGATSSTSSWRSSPPAGPEPCIHIHDIFYPFEYPHEWAVAENRSWNEALRAARVPSFNLSFEILFFNDFFAQLAHRCLERDCPSFP
jgi:hypothetical protein